MLSCLILYNNNEPFLYQIVTCSEKWFYMTISNDRLSGWTKQKLQSTSQSQTCTNKRVMVIVWWSTPCLIHYSFLNPDKTITSEKYAQQIDERCIFNAYSQHWSTERAQFFSMTTPQNTLHNQCFKSEMNWATMVCLICYNYLTSHQLTTTSSSILTTFSRENVSTTSRMEKMLSKY